MIEPPEDAGPGLRVLGEGLVHFSLFPAFLLIYEFGINKHTRVLGRGRLDKRAGSCRRFDRLCKHLGWPGEGTVIAGGSAALGRGTQSAGFSQGRDSDFIGSVDKPLGGLVAHSPPPPPSPSRCLQRCRRGSLGRGRGMRRTMRRLVIFASCLGVGVCVDSGGGGVMGAGTFGCPWGG